VHSRPRAFPGRARRRVAPAALALLVAVATTLAASALTAAAADTDEYGGFTSIGGRDTGRFHLERIDGVWWFVDPNGHAFFSTGVNTVNAAGDFAPALGRSPYLDAAIDRYGSAERWADATRRELRSWGVNTVGAFSLPNLFAGTMPYTVLLNFSQYAPRVSQLTPSSDNVRDYLGPWFGVAARAYAEDAASGCAADPWCIGVFTDNEPAWGRSQKLSSGFLHQYTATVPGASAKVAVQRFLERRYDGDVTRFNAVWGTQLQSFDGFQQLNRLGPDPASPTAAQLEDELAFRKVVARAYFRTTDAALRSVSKDLLNLGPRFEALQTPADVYEVAGRYVDVVSINDYELLPETRAQIRTQFASEGFLFSANPWDDLDTVERLAKRPILISEFGYRAQPAGGPQGMRSPGFPFLADQQARADRYRQFVDELYARPFVVGAHWFQLMDQPAEGRADGQDSNWGLTDVAGEPYRPLVDAVADAAGALPEARQR
jgi:hypothetical protein